MTSFLSRYHPHYVRALVYMMQASEYRVPDFLRWFWRTEDFRRVEERKELVKTPKSAFLLAAGYFLLTFLWVSAVWVLLDAVIKPAALSFPIVVLSIPYLLAYTLAAVLLLVNTLQWPVEYMLTERARRRLARHKGLKIGIAGSFGKTSMREVLKAILSVGKKVAAPPGSYNTPLGISSFVKTLQGDEEVLIFELGEYYPGDIKHLCRAVQPDIGVITGINEAHLEKFGDLERTRQTIFELADYLGENPLYINGENPLALEHAHASNLIYGRTGVGEVKVGEAQTSLGGTSFTLHLGSETIHARSKLLGLHQVGPLSVAVHIALRLGLTPPQIEKGITQTRPFEHRLEPKTDTHGVVTLDDSYNGNPDGVRAVIEFLSTLKGKRRWYITPGLVEMGARKEAVHKEIGKELARAAIEKVLLVRNSVTPFIAKGLQEGRFAGELIWFSKAVDAFAALPSLTVKGDVVLLQNDWPDQYS